SPGPTSTHGAAVGSRPRWTRDDLYEQCSDHMTAYMASSRWFGSRPRMRSMAAASSSVSPRARWTLSAASTDITVSERWLPGRVASIVPNHGRREDNEALRIFGE